MWDLPGPGLEPVSPALAGGFLTTAPPGKPQCIRFYENILEGHLTQLKVGRKWGKYQGSLPGGSYIYIFWFVFNIYLFILAALGLSCGTWALSLRRAGFSLVAVHRLLSSCGTRAL